MLNLYVMRHSKSSWNEHNINDFERPLSKRGRKDIKLIIAFLKKKKINVSRATLYRTIDVFVKHNLLKKQPKAPSFYNLQI